MSKILLAVRTCAMFRGSRVKAQRETWAQPHAEIDIRFFYGRNPIRDLQPDEVQLDVDDSYQGLPMKVREICRWALANGYTYVFMCDDDVYVQVDRLMASDFAQLGHYVGRKRCASGGLPAPYCSGFSYWLSAKAMKVVAEAATMPSQPFEDRWVGNVLFQKGIHAIGDYRYLVIDSRRNAKDHGTEGPRRGNLVITAAEFDADRMHKVHQEWLTVRTGDPIRTALLPTPFTKVCVLIKTFLRDGFLFKCVDGIEKTLPGAKMVIVDDGEHSIMKQQVYSRLRSLGHVVEIMPFDSGFGNKGNQGVTLCDRPYVLIGSDDFDFSLQAMDGIARMVYVLDHDPDVDVVSGRVANNPYEALLRIENNKCIETRGYRETRQIKDVTYHITDLTVNYSLIRREVFEHVQWDGGDIKIGGGEHGAFYLDLKQEGYVVASLPDAIIYELKGQPGWADNRYGGYRGRARTPGRPCLKKRGIDFYQLMGGGVETT